MVEKLKHKNENVFSFEQWEQHLLCLKVGFNLFFMD